MLLPPRVLVPETDVLAPTNALFSTQLPVTFRAPIEPDTPIVSVPVPSAAVSALALLTPVTDPPNVTLLFVVVSVTSADSVAFPV